MNPLTFLDRPLRAVPTDAPGIAVAGPQDAELQPLWQFAQAKAEAELGHPPATKREWNLVTALYDELTHKQRTSIAALARAHREVCPDLPRGD